jgi:sodium transport system permease protein
MHEYFANGRLARLCLKELRESLRDRRTIITLILMPILVYPLLSMALQRLLLGAVGPSKANTEYVIGVEDERTARVVAAALRETQRAANDGVRASIEIRRPASTASRTVETLVPAPGLPLPDAAKGAGQLIDSNTADVLQGTSDAAFSIVVPEGTTVSQSLSYGQLDLAVLSGSLQRIALPTGGISPAFEFQMEFRDGDPRSEAAMSEFRKAMQLINDFQLVLVRGNQMPPSVQLVSTAIGQRFDPMASLAGILPLVLILMTITGAVYPAIDLTAGERERGTMEAMIATPAPRFILLLSKYVAVVTVAVLTALANLFASWLTLSMGGLGRALLGERGFSIWVLLQILPLLVIFAAFFSAILLAMCSFARSFKEAQAYLIPVMLVSLAPALVTLMPNVEFSTLLGIVPLINILLLSRDIMTGSPAALPAFAAVLSTLLYAGAALVVASRLFGAESATAGSQESWSELVRRPKRWRARPDVGELAVYLAMLFPVFFVATNLAGQWQLDIQPLLVINAALLIVLFLIAPAVYVWYRRIRFRETFLLTFMGSAPGGGWQGALRLTGVVAAVVLMASGLWIVAYEALKTLSDLGFGTIDLERIAGLEEAKAKFRAVPLWLLLATSALAPAVAEEFFFRGFVLSALRSRLSGVRAVVYSAILFGLFHVVNGSVLSIERFVPTALLGLALGVLAVRTDTLWPGILLHAIHNGLLFWLTRFNQAELAQWFGSEQEHFPVPWVVGSLLSIGIGIAILFASTLKRSDEITA